MEEELRKLFGKWYRDLNAQFRHHMDKELTAPQLQLLDLLIQNGPMRISDIAEQLQVTVGAVTLLSDRMHKMDCILRERSQTDRRVVLLSITDHGRNLFEESVAIWRKAMHGYISRLTPEEIKQLHGLFRKMIER
jgi:DNA-binding MarR family transcriptional regulator